MQATRVMESKFLLQPIQIFLQYAEYLDKNCKNAVIRIRQKSYADCSENMPDFVDNVYNIVYKYQKENLSEEGRILFFGSQEISEIFLSD